MNQNGDLNARQKWIQWVLDFVQTDLAALPKLRMETLVEEASSFLSLRVRGDVVTMDTVLQLPWKQVHKAALGNRFNSFQNALKQMVEWIINPATRYPLPSVNYSLTHFSGRFSKAIVHDLTDKEYQDRLAVHNFSDLINGVQINSIKKCKGCGRYFVDLTERKKIFCTYPCASRSIARFKREELKKDPKKYKAYLKKQREYLKKRYNEMRRAQLGPNVKVGRKGR